MINALLTGIFNLIIGLVNALLSPIDALIQQFIPDLATGLSYISNFFDYIGNFISFILSWFHLPTPFITLIVAYWTFKLTVPLLVHTVKLAISWYDKLKP